MITSPLALVALVAWLVLVLDLRHRATLRAGRDPWEQVGPRSSTPIAPSRSVSTVGSLSRVDDPAATGADRSGVSGWTRAA